MNTILTEGRKAPAFKAKDQNGNDVSLADFKGRRLVLFFYPQDDTPTCTVQACNIRDHWQLLQQHKISVVGISPDEVARHKKFETKHALPQTLLADPKHTIIKKYGVWGPKQLYGRQYMGLHRTSFLIDEKGVVKKVILKPKSKDHAAEIITAWQAIDAAKK